MSIQIEDIKQALAIYNGDLHKTSQYLNIKYQTLYYHIKKNNIKYNNKRSQIDISVLQKLYDKHQSLSLVAKEIGVTKEGVRGAMKKAGLQINDPIIYSFNNEFFKKDTEKSFYWAGFIAADGCIILKHNSNILSIALSQKDKNHLIRFKNDINAEHPIYDYLIKNSKRNFKWNDTYKSEIKICSENYYKDLQKFNITYRKTKTYVFPNYVLDHNFCNHFMRGYFDGDGSWYYQKENKLKNQLCFNVRGTTNFLKQYRSILIKACQLNKTDEDVRVNNNCGILEYKGNLQCNRIANYLYNDSTTYLERKYNIITAF